MENGHGHGDGECGCGGVCKWDGASKEEKVAMLERKEARLQKMLEHVKNVKEAVVSGKKMEMGHEKE